jgi:protein-tyrosine kinase
MSLVETAITRMRRTGGAEAQSSPLEPTATAGVAPAEQPPGERKDARQLNIDLNSLRATGYLPEQEKDRQFADHYRQIKRPLIQKAMAPTDGNPALEPRIVMVTSALPGDGKTFTSINLAFSIARERDVSVLLVDADLLKPHVSRIFGLQKEPGLMDALMDESVSIESLIVATNVRGLSILPAGTLAEGTSELLHSRRMRDLVHGLCGLNPRRMVLLDSPPLLVTSEGPALTTLSGQIVLVVRAGQTPRQAITDAMGLIDEQRAGGIVLNEAPVDILRGYYYGAYGSYGDAPSPKT